MLCQKDYSEPYSFGRSDCEAPRIYLLCQVSPTRDQIKMQLRLRRETDNGEVRRGMGQCITEELVLQLKEVGNACMIGVTTQTPQNIIEEHIAQARSTVDGAIVIPLIIVVYSIQRETKWRLRIHKNC